MIYDNQRNKHTILLIVLTMTYVTKAKLSKAKTSTLYIHRSNIKHITKVRYSGKGH